MKKNPKSNAAIFCLALAGAAALAFAQEAANEKKESPPAAIAEIGSRLKRDTSPLPAGGQLQMSYADVVEKILPSVVTLFPSSPVGGMDFSEEDLQQIPPQFRDFFYRYFGVPRESDPFERRRNQPAPRREAPRQRGVGSGVIITADGYILTNNHVVEGADDIEVAVETGGVSKTYKAKVVGTDPLTDVGLIKIDAKGLTPAVMGDSSQLRVGDVVLAAGAPMQLNLSVTQGIVSALGRSNMRIVGQGNLAGFEDFIQTDAAINPGNSGGPLVDALGRVIGINTAILSRTGMNGGIGFAIPINMALGIVNDLLEDGQVRRGYLGVEIMDVNYEDFKRLGLEEQRGALVRMVGGDSPADKAGIEPDDVIVSVDGQRVDNSARLRLLVSSYKPGTSIQLEVLRNGKRLTMTAKLDELPTEALAAGSPRLMPRGREPENRGEIIPGLRVSEMTAAVRKQERIPNSISGLLVEEVDPNSGAAAMGIQKGDVILEINRTEVESLKEARELVSDNDSRVLMRIYRDGDTMLVMVGLDKDE